MDNNISQRLKNWLDMHNLPASKFADILGVQKSSISHILSGRNKPSFDFIQKFKEHFPDLDLEWFITGKTSKPVTDDNKNETPRDYVEVEVKTEEITNINHPETKQNIPMQVSRENNLIDYIMIVYKDDTFKIINKRN